jgi:hypothetical protein
VIALIRSRVLSTSIGLAMMWSSTAARGARAEESPPVETVEPVVPAPAVPADTLEVRAGHPIAASLRDVAPRSKLTLAAGGGNRIRGKYEGSTATALRLRVADRDSTIEFAAIQGLWVEGKRRKSARILATIVGAAAGGLYLQLSASDNDYDVAGRPIEHSAGKRFLFGAVLGAGAGWMIGDLLWHGRDRPRRLYP